MSDVREVRARFSSFAGSIELTGTFSEPVGSPASRIVNARTQVILGGTTLSGAQFLDLLASPCRRTCLSWEPGCVVPLVGCPVLRIGGTKDVQAPAVDSAAAAR